MSIIFVYKNDTNVCYHLRTITFVIQTGVVIVYLYTMRDVFCMCVKALEAPERIKEMRRILTEELIEDNYFILKYLINFLTEVRSSFYAHLLKSCSVDLSYMLNIYFCLQFLLIKLRFKNKVK